MDPIRRSTSDILLTRRGLLALPAARGGASSKEVAAVLLEFVALGYVGSHRLRDGLEALSTAQLAEVRESTIAALAAQLGADQKHKPLFRRFPRGIPRDTDTLWFQRVLCAYIQEPDQPCLWCQREGTTHVLRPCMHVVCNLCYDGSNDAACPICNRHVDPDNPFFGADDVREQPVEQVRFKLLTLVEDADATAREIIQSFCARKQALNPTDKADFIALLDGYGGKVLDWLPEQIPLKENVALVFGRLFALCPADAVLEKARAYIRTATDVLRLIAVHSGADAGLQGETLVEKKVQFYRDMPWWAEWVKNVERATRRHYENMSFETHVSRQIYRFPVAKLPRSVRRALMSILEGFEEHTLIEDMLRHRAYWVAVGEFLHPGEYAKRFPKLARAFAILRKKSPDGVRAERFRGFQARVEVAAANGDAEGMLEVLERRPGEFARRLDHVLRLARKDPRVAAKVVESFCANLQAYSLPVLLTLYAFLPTRTARAKRRMFWPKGGVATAVTISDKRPTLRLEDVQAMQAPIERELLRRFADHPHFDTALIDESLAEIIAPFNERTASPAAVNLPRGSTVHVPRSKVLRMFLHWCEPPGGDRTDIDLSIGFYDRDWNHVGVCSYYQLQLIHDGQTIAHSSGDLTSAPYPDGASEFVDLHRDAANETGIRYAVMVVNAFAGVPFSKLERGFAGLMLRDDTKGHHFDPRTVVLKFALQGEHGVFTPLCIDLETDTLHWLDIYSKGALAMNNVANSNQAITRVCPETMEYFQSRIRLDMRRLALLHAAARCRRVLLRADELVSTYERRDGETPQEFLHRLQADDGPVDDKPLELGDAPVLAILHRGDVALPNDSSAYALFREQVIPTMDAADLIS